MIVSPHYIIKEIPNYPNYFVNRCGLIMSVPRKGSKGGILTPSTDKGGYKQVLLYNDTGVKQFYVHRIVAEVFIGEINNMEVNHIYGIKSDNRVSQIEIVTKKENIKHSNKYIRKKQTKGIIYCTNGDTYLNIIDAALAIGIERSLLGKCLNGKRINYTNLSYDPEFKDTFIKGDFKENIKRKIKNIINYIDEKQT